jgi:hypothetical protein
VINSILFSEKITQKERCSRGKVTFDEKTEMRASATGFIYVLDPHTNLVLLNLAIGPLTNLSGIAVKVRNSVVRRLNRVTHLKVRGRNSCIRKLNRAPQHRSIRYQGLKYEQSKATVSFGAATEYRTICHDSVSCQLCSTEMYRWNATEVRETITLCEDEKLSLRS